MIEAHSHIDPLSRTKVLCDLPRLDGRRHQIKIPFAPIGPKNTQPFQVRQAQIFINEAFKAGIEIIQGPLIEIAVLKDAATLKVMLTHRASEGKTGSIWHRIFQFQFSPCHVKGVFIPMDVPVPEFAVLIHP